MPRHQIVGQVESVIEIRANHFCDAVLRSSTDDAVRHQLMTINKLHARLRSDQVFLGNNKTEPGVEIRDEIRRLSRSIMRSVLVRHRQPRFNHMNPGIDHRRVTVGAAVKALHAPHWNGIRGMRRSIGKNGKPTQTEVSFPAPLKACSWFESRGGTIAKTMLLIKRGAGAGRQDDLVIGILSDMEKTFRREPNGLSASA
jgi:putative transposase